MTNDDLLFGYRLQMFALAAEIGVRPACRQMGVHHSTYYAWKRRAERSGLEVLRPRERRLPRMPNQLPAMIEERIVAFSLGHAGLGPKRIAAQLARPEWGRLEVSPNGVWKVLVRHGLNTRAKRLALIAGHGDADAGVHELPERGGGALGRDEPGQSSNLIAVWQQDRWSALGANGLVGGYTADGGATWTQTSATFSHCTGGNAGNGGDYDRATDPWVTIAPDGTAYFLSISLQVPGTRHEMAVARSTNGGQTWSQPKRISTPSGKPAFTPAIAVSNTGTVGVVYYDFRRDDSGNPLPTDLWMVTSGNAGATWSEQHVSGPFDMRNAPESGGFFVGDYIGLTAVGSAFHPVWVEATSVDNVTDVYTTTVTP